MGEVHELMTENAPLTLETGTAVLGDLAVRGYKASLHCEQDRDEPETVKWWLQIDVTESLDADQLQGLIDVATAHHRELVQTWMRIEIR